MKSEEKATGIEDIFTEIEYIYKDTVIDERIDLLKEAKKELEKFKTIDKLECIKITIQNNKVAKKDLSEMEERLKKKRGVYIIVHDYKKDKIDEMFSNDNKKKKDRKYSRYNNIFSNKLYVGSCSGEKSFLHTRLRQHLAADEKCENISTYALWLSDWFEGKLKIYYWIPEEGLDRKSVQLLVPLIEDIISESVSPMFGRRGSNNQSQKK